MEKIRMALYATGGKGARKALMELATDYDSMTLGHKLFPEKCLNLIIEILSVDELFNKPGIDIFLLKISTDMKKLSSHQKQELLDAICNNYCHYTDMELCWVIGDMIARHYDQTSAMRAFKKIFNSATEQGKEGVALGLDIIARHSKRDPRIMKEIDSIFRQSN